VTKIKKIIFLVLISFICIEKGNAEISDSLFMTIGNKPITKSDIVNEIKLILILNNQSYSDEKREQLHDAAINSTVKRNVKEIELERNNFFQFNEEDVEKELNRLANNIYVDLDTLKNIFASNNLDFSIIEKQVKIELFWNSLIFEIYKNRITINLDHIDERLRLLQNKKRVEEYLISEIVIKNVEKNKFETEIKELKNKIKIEGFENVAKNLSISESAMKGGDLGWLNENIVSDKVRSTLVNTPVGSLSDPIQLPNGILIFQVRNKRNVSNNLSMEQMKNQIVDNEKNKILNMYSLSHYDKVRRSISIKFYQ
jgi:peptidyl-prolyl cis-trans isomerase SurA